MGRSRLYRFVDSTIDAVETRVAALGGQAASSGSTEWVSHVTLYSPSNAPQIGAEDMVLMRTSDADHFVYTAGTALECDAAMHTQLVPLLAAYKLRQKLTITGKCFRIGDTVIRCGSVVLQKASPKGIVVEVEYEPQPCDCPSSTALDEMITKHLGLELTQSQCIECGRSVVAAMAESASPRNRDAFYRALDLLELFRSETQLLSAPQT